MEGWVKIHRKIIDWEWYKDISAKIVFLHLLLTANYEDKNWKGITIKRGQKVTSINHLAKETNLTSQQVRTALDKLKSTGEITIKPTNKYSLITVEKYANYQDVNLDNNIQNNTQQNNQITTTKEIKNNKNIYIYLYKKYSRGKLNSFKDKMKFLNDVKNDNEFKKMTYDEQYNFRTYILGGNYE